jgi:hypothetical protein
MWTEFQKNFNIEAITGHRNGLKVANVLIDIFGFVDR